jgi:predicted AlkP superfamily phosphohydrolase/phosphomutase/tetratricopeptide (TPR) repeat protein
MPRKVLLIGWDAADWKIINPLMDQGKMPNLQKLVNQGVMGNLSTLYPVLSPMLWTSIATGKRAHKHGIHGFSEPDPQSGGVRPITNLGRKVKAIWNILNQHGLKSNVVGWWPSHPAEPINGVMVSDFYQKPVGNVDETWPMRPGAVHPPRLIEPLAEFRIHPGELEGDMLLPFVPRAAEIDQEKDKRLGSVAKVLAEISSVHAAATALMQLEPWDFMAVYFDGIDHFCHGFMQYHPPRLEWVKEEDYELYKDVVSVGYQYHDLMLGVYRQLAGDDTTIIIVSDHGFHPDHLRPRELPNEAAGPADEHRDFGIIAIKGPGIKQDQLVFGASLLDVTPTILALYGLPQARDMDGKPLLNAFAEPPVAEYLDSWEAVPGEDGRHPPGMQVDPVDQAEALKQLVELGYIDKPEENLEKAVANTIKELRHNLARDLYDSKRLPEAAAMFAELWDAEPDESRFGVKLLDCQLGLGKAEDAQASLQRLIREKQRYAAVATEELQQLTEALKDKQPEDYSEDEQHKIRQLHQKAGVNTHTFAYLSGRVAAALGEHEQALEEFAKAKDVQIHNRPALFQQMAESLLALERWQEAQAQLEEILAIDPINAHAQLGLCRVYLGLKKPKKALDAALASVGLIYHNPIAHFYCALARRRLGRQDEAIESLQVALAQNPVFPAAHRCLADIYRRRECVDKANEHRSLADAAEQRIAAFKAGGGLPEDADVKLDVDLLRGTGLYDLAGSESLPPPSPETVMIVSGLPRSGTSMLMQMLEAGGLPILTDGERAADESNQRGYFELEAVKRLPQDPERAWLHEAGGKAVKVIAQLLPSLPPGVPYRILFMARPLGEILASQQAMLQRSGKQGSKQSQRQLAATYLKQLEQIRQVLAAYPEQVQVLNVDYHRTLANPEDAAARVNAFLGGGLDETAMAEAVEPQLRRERS